MSDLISRAEAFASLQRIKKANKAGYYDNLQYWEIETWLDNLPSAEKTGKWILVDEAEPRRYGCPYCKRLSYTMDNYCSYCGARLVEE